MAWHHIIPFSLLREVWNRLVDQQIDTELPEAKVAIRQYLMLVDRSLQSDADGLIDRMRAENRNQARANHNHLEPLNDAEANQLRQSAVWPAWNIVEGPLRRSDDPGDRYFDRFTAGLIGDEIGRMRAIEVLFGDLGNFANGPAPGAASLRALARAASVAGSILRCDQPIPFRPEMWVQDTDTSLWSKRRERERQTPAA